MSDEGYDDACQRVERSLCVYGSFHAAGRFIVLAPQTQVGLQ